MKKYYFFLLLLTFAGCSYKPAATGVIRIKGSDTMLHLTELLAQEYMKDNPGISIYVEGGGSATGIKSLTKGGVDIAIASRTLKGDEVKILAEQYGSIGMATMIAKDALSIYVNKNNPLTNFTVEELKNIFTGKIKNWKEIGGMDEIVVPVIRTPNSGTYLYFKEHILGGEEYSSSCIVESTTEDVIKVTGEKDNAVGYGGIGYNGTDIIHASINNVKPDEENVRNNSYPIARYLYFYTLQAPEGLIKNFIDWVVSPAGQEIISGAGYIPIWERTF